MASPSTTSISELPIDPGISAATNNIVLEQKEKKSFSDNILEAKNAGLTQLPSRDIPTTGLHHVTDETTNANYVPSPESPEDYIKNHNNEKEYMERARAMNRQKGTFDMLFDEFRVSILVSLLFFLFQLPIFKSILNKYLEFLFKKDGNYNFYGYIFVSCLFGAVYYGVERVIEHFSI